MLYILLLYFVVHGAGGKSSWECTALDGVRVPNGEKYVPGPDHCTVCKCEKGEAQVCQAVLCQPPQDCDSFRIGRKCCDFVCVDGVLPERPGSNPSTDLGLRMVASAVTAILSLALLLFLIHRLRQRRLRGQQQYYEDQLDSPGALHPNRCHGNACCHNAAYCNGNNHVDFFLDGHTPPYSLWKPPSFYFPHEDAPPPYSEVVGSSFGPSEVGSSLPALGSLVVQLGPPPGESSDSSRGRAPLVMGAMGGGLGRPLPPPPALHPPNTDGIKGATLRSDEMYEDAAPEDLPPPYYPPARPMSGLNREARSPGGAVPGCSDGVGADRPMRECACGESVCSLCAPHQQASTRNSMQPSGSPVRMRSREKSSTSVKRDGERTSAMEEFHMRLSMDISDSSTSTDAPTRTFSSSSEDSTSMDLTSEMP